MILINIIWYDAIQRKHMYIMSILSPAFIWFLRAFLGMATRSMA